MPTLSDERLESLLRPYLGAVTGVPDPSAEVNLHLLRGQLSVYLDLLVRWNAKTNLTAIRDPEAMVSRHLGESLFAARCLQTVELQGVTLLDFGSGAGLPGIPMQLWSPGLAVTLAESQRKKAAFLREAVRRMGLRSTVWDGRVEDLPSVARFDCVAMRAVDAPEPARAAAWERVRPGGWLLEMVAGERTGSGCEWMMPGLEKGIVRLSRWME